MPADSQARAVSVIMINRNGGAMVTRAVATCRTAIESALTLEPRVEFVFVDNASTDHPEAGVEQALAGAAFAWRIVHESQAGVNFARNAGIRESTGELLLFVDSDLTFDQGWLRAYVEAATARPDVDVLAGKVRVGELEIEPPDWLALNGPLARTSIVVQCDYGDSVSEFQLDEFRGPVGPNMGFRRRIFDRVGPFDTRFGLRPGSLVPGAESEFFDRLARGGITFLYVPGASVDHPLRKSQMTRAYFKARMGGIGRATSRLRMVRGVPAKRVCGLTLYVLPHLLGAARRVVTTTMRRAHPAERFHAVTDVAFFVGYLWEDFSAWRGETPGKERAVGALH